MNEDLPEYVREVIRVWLESQGGSDDAVNLLRAYVHSIAPNQHMPVDYVRWVPLELVEANNYNPNSVARAEMGLLLKSIEADGYTQPVVTMYDETKGKYVIVDGFHRYMVLRANEVLREKTGGRLPIVVIEKDVNDRMASTVRHNRARGKHSVDGMANMVFKMLDGGWTDAEICNELGMEPEELVRLKHITGFSKLFADAQYNRAWVTRSQIRVRKAYEAAQAGTVEHANNGERS
jgi:hypothetical protein